MKTSTLSLLVALAGFAVGFPLSHAFRTPVEEFSPLPGKSDTDTRPWSASSLAPADRMAAIAEKAASLDPAEWPAFFRAQMDSPETSRLLARLWAERDPAGFWKWLRESGDVHLLDRFANDLVRVWAMEQPDQAMEALLKITDKELGDQLRRTAVDTVLADDLAKGMQLAAQAGDFNRFSWGPREWITKDPANAVSALAALPAVSDYRHFLFYAVPAWLESDPVSALAWLKSAESGPRERWLAEAYKAAAEADPQAALDAARSLQDPQLRDDALSGVLASGRIDPAKFPELLAELPLSQQSEIGLRRFFSSQPKDAAEFANMGALFEALPASENNLSSLGTFAMHWQSADPVAGWQWATSLPDAAMRRSALEGMARQATPEQLDAIAKVSLNSLSDQFFESALGRIPPDKQDAWISSLPPAHAAWARATKEKKGSR
jgi:hypothetical protein